MAVDDKETADRIRQAALRLFSRRGFEATGIRDVARDADISTAGLYHYIGGKQDLLLDIIRSAMHDLHAMGEMAVSTAATPPAKLAAITRVHVLFHGSHQLEAVVGDSDLRSLTGSSRAIAIQLRDEYEALWTDVLAEGLASGDFHMEEPSLVRLALMQMATGVAYWFNPAGELALGVIADQFADLALRMVGSTSVYDDPVAERHVLRRNPRKKRGA
jgi:AcrR family transcriptional regulator